MIELSFVLVDLADDYKIYYFNNGKKFKQKPEVGQQGNHVVNTYKIKAKEYPAIVIVNHNGEEEIREYVNEEFYNVKEV